MGIISIDEIKNRKPRTKWTPNRKQCDICGISSLPYLTYSCRVHWRRMSCLCTRFNSKPHLVITEKTFRAVDETVEYDTYAYNSTWDVVEVCMHVTHDLDVRLHGAPGVRQIGLHFLKTDDLRGFWEVIPIWKLIWGLLPFKCVSNRNLRWMLNVAIAYWQLFSRAILK